MFSLPAIRELSVAASSIECSTLNTARVSQKTKFLIELKPSPVVLLEGARDRCHRSEMLTSEDHRQLAERCIRLAKTCTKAPVAEQLEGATPAERLAVAKQFGIERLWDTMIAPLVTTDHAV